MKTAMHVETIPKNIARVLTRMERVSNIIPEEEEIAFVIINIPKKPIIIPWNIPRK